MCFFMASTRTRFLISTAITLLLTGCAGGGSIVSGGSVPSPTASPSAPPVVLPVDGKVALVMNVPWTNTGMNVSTTSHVSIVATGEFNRETGSCNGNCVTTPAGDPWSTCSSEPPPPYTAPGLPCWSLIAKVGTAGTPFYVGTSLTFTPTTSGVLYLGINDNYYPDDTGNWIATLNITNT